MKRKKHVVNFYEITVVVCLYATAPYFPDRYGKFWPEENNDLVNLQHGLISINVRIPEEDWEKFQKISDRYYANNKDKFESNIEVRLCLTSG